ncbi:WD40 repeat domain-containing protein [Cyanobacteria bacterium FACHB-63]|nr:WD40 repeat domain-containing protein [Cyanobacteria bacterium FACHB-63]
MSLRLGQLIYTSFTKLGFQALTSAAVPAEIHQAFIEQIVQQHWDSYNPPSANYRAAYLYQISSDQTLFGWLYNDGADNFHRSHVPYFVCYYLANSLQSNELKTIFTCLLKGPIELVDRDSQPQSLKEIEISNESYQSARLGIGIFAAIQKQAHLSIQQDRLFRMFVSEDPTGYHVKVATSISVEENARNQVKAPKMLSSLTDEQQAGTDATVASEPQSVEDYSKLLEELIARSQLEPEQPILLSNAQLSANQSAPSPIWKAGAIGIAALIALGSISVYLLQSAPSAVVPSSSSQHSIAESSSPLLEKSFLDTAPVWSVALSPDGQTVIGSGANQAIKVWNIETGKVIKTLSGHQDVVRWLMLTQNGNTLISGSGDRTIKIWNLQTNQVMQTLNQGSPVWGLALSLDEKTLYSGGEDGALKLWQFPNGTLLGTIAAHQRQIFSVAISPNGKIVATASLDRTIKLWNAQTGALVRTITGHTDAVRAVVFSPDGKTLASASWDKTLKLWNWQSGALIRTWVGHQARVVDVRFSPDGQTLISGSVDHTINVWAVQDGTLLRSLSDHGDWVLSLSIAPQSTTASSRFASGSKDETIRIWKFP